MSLQRTAVVGLGYVGLPLAIELARSYECVGVDISTARVAELESGFDRTREIATEALKASSLRFTTNFDALATCQVVIVAVPTPVLQDCEPDLSLLRTATHMVGCHLRPGMIVVFESTVYPGATESVCVPLLQEASGLTLGRDFEVGYSPERINPGDRGHGIHEVVKVVSASSPAALEVIDAMYGKVSKVGTFRAGSIRIAEAAKVIENVQRDVNIALVNEFARIFHALDLDTYEVLEAARTKWNFLDFRPGLVGGHCIGVDPYYLTYAAREAGIDADLILAGRAVNEAFPDLVAAQINSMLDTPASRILVCGITFKENCPDIRNSLVPKVLAGLTAHGADVDVWDPLADPEQVKSEYGISLATEPVRGSYDVVALLVAHREFTAFGKGLRSLLHDDGKVFDLKGVLEDGVWDVRP